MWSDEVNDMLFSAAHHFSSVFVMINETHKKINTKAEWSTGSVNTVNS